MAESEASQGRIFISYRHQEAAWPAQQLYDVLVEHFSPEHVFKDIDNIGPGEDFVRRIIAAVESCDVLLALIGPQWLTITNKNGQLRLDDPNDFVRLEIEAALTRSSVRVIPILVDGATMPRAEELPPSLAGLVRRQAVEVNPARFDFDTRPLLKVLGEGRSKSPNRTPRRLVMIGAPFAALLAIYLIIQLVMDQPSPQENQENNGAQSSASSEFKAETPKPLLVDDFRTHAYGWEGPGGGYLNGVYRVDVDPRTKRSTSIPRNASSVYPSPPSDLRIEVDARSLEPLDDRSGYGVICRLKEGTNYRYQFTIGEGGEDTVRITKVFGDKSRFLAVGSVASLNATVVNRIRADCSNVRDAAQGAVHLVFSLNGQIVAEATDSDQPLPGGTVGIRVFALGQNGIRAEFDNFVVTSV
jgi:hypothetical protein